MIYELPTTRLKPQTVWFGKQPLCQLSNSHLRIDLSRGSKYVKFPKNCAADGLMIKTFQVRFRPRTKNCISRAC